MAPHTTFKIGGPADCFAEPDSTDELSALLAFARASAIPVTLVGGGSNLLVADRGIRGLVVSLARFSAIDLVSRNESPPDGCFTEVRVPDASAPEGRVVDVRSTPSRAESVLVRAGAGASMEALVAWCAERSLAGLERFAGLPGSVGGAAFMNARCYERSVSDVFFAAETLRFRDGRYTIEEMAFDPADWDYKKSPFQDRSGADEARIDESSAILLSVTFSLVRGDSGSIGLEMDKYVKDRECKGHFRFPSAGSMFKNNHAFGKPSGKIIDEAGLRGFRVGDAQVAPWHGNIVINAGHATAREVKALVDGVRDRVRETTGFELEPEVIMAGDWE